MPSLVDQYVSLVRTGTVFRGKCPFHREKEGMSFVVYADHAFCFGRCDKPYYPVSFLMQILGISYVDAKAKIENLPPVILPTFAKQVKKSNLSAIPAAILHNWRSMLKDRQRGYFHSRLFTDETIDREQWGWDGHRFVLVVWEGEPGQSKPISVRRRSGNENLKPKYIGLKGYNDQCLYNLWNAERVESNDILIFFGEFDTALAYQDGLASVSPTNGQNTWNQNWNKYFYDADQYIFHGRRLIIVPDKGEELRGFQLASRFLGNAEVFQWPEGDFSDYNSFRLAGGSVNDFLVLRNK